jgi:hypothetical protein
VSREQQDSPRRKVRAARREAEQGRIRQNQVDRRQQQQERAAEGSFAIHSAPSRGPSRVGALAWPGKGKRLSRFDGPCTDLWLTSKQSAGIIDCRGKPIMQRGRITYPFPKQAKALHVWQEFLVIFDPVADIGRG